MSILLLPGIFSNYFLILTSLFQIVCILQTGLIGEGLNFIDVDPDLSLTSSLSSFIERERTTQSVKFDVPSPDPARSDINRFATLGLAVAQYAEMPWIGDIGHEVFLPKCENPEMKIVAGGFHKDGCEFVVLSGKYNDQGTLKPIITVSLRSTELGGWQDWKADFKMSKIPLKFENCEEENCKKCSCDMGKGKSCPLIHKGFLNYYNQVRERIISGVKEALKDNGEAVVLVGGHSMGASLAHLASFDLVCNGIVESSKIRVIIMGFPVIGDETFAKRYENLIPIENYGAYVTELPVKHRLSESFYVDIITTRNILMKGYVDIYNKKFIHIFPKKYSTGMLQGWDIHQQPQYRNAFERFPEIYGVDVCTTADSKKTKSTYVAICWKGNENTEDKHSFYKELENGKCVPVKFRHKSLKKVGGTECEKHEHCKSSSKKGEKCTGQCYCGKAGINECHCVEKMKPHSNIHCGRILYIGTSKNRPLF